MRTLVAVSMLLLVVACGNAEKQDLPIKNITRTENENMIIGEYKEKIRKAGDFYSAEMVYGAGHAFTGLGDGSIKRYEEELRPILYNKGIVEFREYLINAQIALAKDPVCDEKRRGSYGMTVAILREHEEQHRHADVMSSEFYRNATVSILRDYCVAAIFLERARNIPRSLEKMNGNDHLDMEMERAALRNVFLKKAGFLQ